MESVAKGNYLRSSTNRMRQVADMVRGKPVDSALAILLGLGMKKKSARMVEKVLKSAVANFGVKSEASGNKAKNLTVKTITVDAGPLMKRIRAHAQGRANRIEKKMSHLTVVVSD
jgi:large subunit ribosomal protein L22